MTIILLFPGALLLVIGLMMSFAPDALYQLAQDVFKLIYKFSTYLNAQFYRSSTHLSKVFLKSEGLFFYRLALSVSFILIGLLFVYSSYYYAQHAALPPPVSGFLGDICHRFFYAVKALDQAPAVAVN